MVLTRHRRALGAKPLSGDPNEGNRAILVLFAPDSSSGLGGMQVSNYPEVNQAPLAGRRSCELGKQVLAHVLRGQGQL